MKALCFRQEASSCRESLPAFARLLLINIPPPFLHRLDRHFGACRFHACRISSSTPSDASLQSLPPSHTPHVPSTTRRDAFPAATHAHEISHGLSHISLPTPTIYSYQVILSLRRRPWLSAASGLLPSRAPIGKNTPLPGKEQRGAQWLARHPISRERPPACTRRTTRTWTGPCPTPSGRR